MAEEIDFENGRNSNFEGLVTLTLTFDPAIQHVVLHQSSTSTYIPNFIQIEETFCGRTDGRTDISSLYIIRSTLGSRPKNGKNQLNVKNGKNQNAAIMGPNGVESGSNPKESKTMSTNLTSRSYNLDL